MSSIRDSLESKSNTSKKSTRKCRQASDIASACSTSELQWATSRSGGGSVARARGSALDEVGARNPRLVAEMDDD